MVTYQISAILHPKIYEEIDKLTLEKNITKTEIINLLLDYGLRFEELRKNNSLAIWHNDNGDI